MRLKFGAVLAALVSSLCCLPALIYLVFGIGVLGSLSNLQWLRVPFGVLSLALMVYAFISSCKECDIRTRKRRVAVWILLFILIFFIIFYPEITYFIIKDD